MAAHRIIELILITVGAITVLDVIVFAIRRIWSKILDRDAVLARLRQELERKKTENLWAELELYELLDEIRRKHVE